MSTRCQIGFYESAEVNLNKPSVLIYRHCDGYPEAPGVLPALTEWAKGFAARRGLNDTEYASVRALVALMKDHGDIDGDSGYGICGDLQLHGDIEYYYRVDPAGITVYQGREWHRMEKLQHVAL